MSDLALPGLDLPVRQQAAPQQHGRAGNLPSGGPDGSTAGHQEAPAENSQHKRSNQAREIFPLVEPQFFCPKYLLERAERG